MTSCLSNFDQISIFDIGKTPLKIDKPVRLIELFAGIGSQAKALKRLGVDFEHYRVCEFDKYAIKSYNAIHGTDFATSDITQITASDLSIVDTDKYCYIATYSFPCQDLSLAGLQKGMAKGGNTRSGLLWEVERLLNECEELPQILLMENVTQVHGKKNIEHFNEWIEYLESKGYSNYWEDLNAKNYGIPQNRDRTFMVSVLGDYTYEFPKPIPLELRLKDMLEESVDDKYYLSDAALSGMMNTTFQQAKYENRVMQENEVCKTILARDYKDPACIQVGTLSGGKWDKMHDISRRVYSGEGTAPTIHTCGGGNLEPKVLCGIGEKKSNGGTQWYQQDRIYDNEIAMSVTTGFLPYYKTEEPSIKKVDIPQIVRVRKYEVDCKRLCEVLRSHKKSSSYNNQDIADHLNVPLTKVEHWFRQDKCFAIPDEDIWLKLKAMLGVETDEFDKAIMTFEEKEGVFEKSNRCYISDGLSPTITSASADEKIIEPAVWDGYNQRIRAEKGTVGTLTQNCGADLKRNGYGIIEPLAYDEQNGYIRKDGTVGTLTTDGSSPKHNNRVVEGVRIRKLTPKECWRLMGFDDEDFDKAAQHNSNAQLYKQAGNSIVVDVLVAIFKNMF